MNNLYENLTEDELWDNFESDFFRCHEPELFEKIKELCGEKGLIDYVAISDAIEFTDYAMDNVMATPQIIFIKKHLVEMANRKEIRPNQKLLAEKYLGKLYHDYFYMF